MRHIFCKIVFMADCGYYVDQQIYFKPHRFIKQVRLH